jgi:hypothetical protein
MSTAELSTVEFSSRWCTVSPCNLLNLLITESMLTRYYRFYWLTDGNGTAEYSLQTGAVNKWETCTFCEYPFNRIQSIQVHEWYTWIYVNLDQIAIKRLTYVMYLVRILAWYILFLTEVLHDIPRSSWNNTPNVGVMSVAVLLRNLQVPVSNLCPETGYPGVFCGFPESLQVPRISVRLLPYTSCLIHYSRIIISFDAT